MSTKRKVPILVGVGEVKNKSTKVEDATEPMQLMFQAINKAIADTGLSPTSQKRVQKRIDSIDVVATWSWPYTDLPGLLGQQLEANLKHKEISAHGGNSPGLMLHRSATRIADGICEMAIVTGGESLGSLMALHKAGIQDPDHWTKRPVNTQSLIESMSDLLPRHETVASKHGVGKPTQIYAMYENGLRAARGQSPQDNSRESAEMYAQFARVASKHPTAWTYGQSPASAEMIEKVSSKNRMICTPYPLLMNAFNNVNHGGACLLTNTDVAEELGIPQRLWIYPLGGAGFEETEEFWLRPNYHSSKAIEDSINTALEVAGMKIDDIDIFDIYSCFPVVPKIVCQLYDISITNPPKPITLLGGLTSFGGAGNNYSTHAILEMVRELRRGPKHNGLVLANGGVLTHEHAIILSNQRPKDVRLSMEEAHHDAPNSGIMFTNSAEGEAVIETYTVEFGRDGRPHLGHVVGRLLPNQHRFIANHADAFTLTELASTVKEPIGRKGWVSAVPDGRNLFSLTRKASL